MLIELLRNLFRGPVKPTTEDRRRIKAGRGSPRSQLESVVMYLTKNAVNDEERTIRLARWMAESITNQASVGKGPGACFEERRGFCGSRARLFVEMAASAGLTAFVFNMFDPGMRHTVAQVRLKGRWRFVDPMYGVVFRRNGELLGFEDMLRDPDAAVESMVVLGGTADRIRQPDGTEEPLDHVAKVRSLYSRDHLTTARSFGFLYGEKPVKFYPTVRFSANGARTTLNATGADPKAFSREAARTFGCYLPNALGATNLDVQQIWSLSNAVPGRLYHLSFSIVEARGNSVDLSCVAWGALVLKGARCRFSADTAAAVWRIRFFATAPDVRLQVSSLNRCAWGNAVIIDGITLSSGEGTPSPPANRAATEAVAAENLAERATIYYRALVEPPRADRLLDFLETRSSLTRSLQAGTYYPYEKRPHNWVWLPQGLAAVYAFRVTGNRRFLQWISGIGAQLARFRDCETGTLDSYRKRCYRSWGTKVPSVKDGGFVWVNEVCTGASMVLPTALMIWEARRSSNCPEELLASLGPLLETCVDVVDEFLEDLVEGPEGAYFVMPHDGDPEPLAHTAPFAALVTVLYAITGEQRYLDVARKLEKYFRSAMTVEADGSWSWPYRPAPGVMTGAGEYFFKARVTLYFPLIAHSLGLLFDRADMVRFAHTFTCAVVRDNGFLYPTVSSAENKAVDDGLLEKYEATKRLPNLRGVLGFYPLAAFDAGIADKITQVQQTYPDIFGKNLADPLIATELYALRLGVNAAVGPCP